LDEAAGTTGLHARRHEAELRLKGAEANLTRLDDVVVTLAIQVEALRKQARQAQRYRRLGEQIRQTEALLFAARWHAAPADAERRIEQVEADLGRESEHLADSEAALARLADERRGLELRIAAAEGARAEAAAQLDAATTTLAAAETGLQQMTEACATG